MISKFFTTLFSIKRPAWTTDGEGNQYSSLGMIATFYGHIQQASAELAQNLGLNMTKTFTIWCPVDTNTKEGDVFQKQSGDPILTNEIQKIAVTNETPRSGYWTLTFEGNTTAQIPWNATEGDIEQILETVIGQGHVEVVGSIVAGELTIEFTHEKGGTDFPLVTINNQISHENVYDPENLVTLAITEVQKGSTTYNTESYVVRAIQKNNVGNNQHLEITVEYDEDLSTL